MYVRSMLIALIFAFPLVSSAAAFGFPRQPLWVSATSAREGDTITMYAAVYNASESEMKGTISFLADGTEFATKAVALGAGDSQLVTNAWKAQEGSHTLSAQFVSGEEKDTTDKISVTIAAAPPAPPPPPSIVDKTVGQATIFVQQYVPPTSAIGNVAGAMIEKVEDVRQAGAAFLTPYAQGSDAPPMNSALAPAASATGFIASAVKSEASFVDKSVQIAAAGALFALNIKWLFYAILVGLLFYILRTVKRWVNRPRF
jgi:hypothetical protein